MNRQSIGHVAYTVSDMEKSLAFYLNALGCQKAFTIEKPQTGEPWIIYLYAGGTQFIELFYGGTEKIEYQDCNIGYSHFSLEVEDIFEAEKRVKDAGYGIDVAPVKAGDGNWQCWVHDPDGNRIELMQMDEASPQLQFLKNLK